MIIAKEENMKRCFRISSVDVSVYDFSGTIPETLPDMTGKLGKKWK
jgi:hypothetical protein